MHWMSVKLSDNFQIREHSWPCLFHIKYMHVSKRLIVCLIGYGRKLLTTQMTQLTWVNTSIFTLYVKGSRQLLIPRILASLLIDIVNVPHP